MSTPTQNQITASGLQIQALADIINELEYGTSSYPGFFGIYGASINLSPNSPDGQLMNLFAQMLIDVEEFIQTIYNSFDPDQAFGVSLDQRVAINGIVRNAGTYTQQQVTVTVSQALQLPGLDLFPNSPFTVADSQGNQYQLLTTYNFAATGSQALAFQAAVVGPVSAAPGTINTQVTILLGVTTVNNASGPTTTGTATETDAALRIRRSNSTSLSSKGYYQGLYGALLATPGVTQALVHENYTGATDSAGVPAHSLWVVVVGGAAAAVAQTIYTKRNAGCGQYGSQSQPITQVDGTTFNILFDYATTQNLYISFTITALTGAFTASYLAAQIRAQISYLIGQTATASQIMALVQSIYPNCYTSAEGVSLTNGSGYAASVNPTNINNIFTIPAGAIKINGTNY